MSWPTALLLALLGAASYYDIRWRRIPNNLLAAGALVGLTLVCLANGPGEILMRAATALAFFILFGIFAWRGMLGFGDVKAIAVMVLLIGWYAAFTSITYAFAMGAVVALGKLARHGKLRDFIALRRLSVASDRGQSSNLPLAPFLFLGTLVHLLIGGAGR